MDLHFWFSAESVGPRGGGHPERIRKRANGLPRNNQETRATDQIAESNLRKNRANAVERMQLQVGIQCVVANEHIRL